MRLGNSSLEEDFLSSKQESFICFNLTKQRELIAKEELVLITLQFHSQAGA